MLDQIYVGLVMNAGLRAILAGARSIETISRLGEPTKLV
jgi:hypothetical protein